MKESFKLLVCTSCKYCKILIKSTIQYSEVPIPINHPAGPIQKRSIQSRKQKAIPSSLGHVASLPASRGIQNTRLASCVMSR